MKTKIITTLVVLVSLLTVSGVSFAGDKGVNGLLFGAGSGALIGQAIGRNTEATLLGTAVGGVLGYIIGNERGKGGYAAVHPVRVTSRTVYRGEERHGRWHRPSHPLRTHRVYVERRYIVAPRGRCR